MAENCEDCGGDGKCRHCGGEGTIVMDAEHYLISAKLELDEGTDLSAYPFTLPLIQNLGEIIFSPQVTFLVGENGSGKSTLLEAIAMAWAFNAEGGSKNFHFSTQSTHSVLYKHLTLVRSLKRPNDGFFLRAESFYNVASYVDAIGAADSYGGESLHAQSHGESFLSLLLHRFRGKGLYILDEPEAALSPHRQLAALVRLHQLVASGSQFIIATHSPILLGYPRATIFSVSDRGLQKIQYEDTEQYRVTKDFLSDPERMIRALLED